jgi:adenosine deaminase
MTIDARVAQIRKLPKVSLHCHLEGCVRPRTLLDLAERHALELGAVDSNDLSSVYRFNNFGEFLRRFRDVCVALATPEDYGRIAAEYVEDALAEGVRYSEIFISPGGWQRLHPQLNLRAAMEAIAEALEHGRQQGLTTSLIVDITRNFGPQVAMSTTQIALSWRDLGVIGIGVGGDELSFPAPLFTGVFAMARRAGLHCVAHAGEAAGAQSVRETIATLLPERIGHGVRAVEDPALLLEIARQGIAFEQSPTSNRMTAVVPRLEDHPIGICVDAGIRVAVDADDPAMFGTTITQELSLLEQRFGWDFMVARLEDAIAVSFAADSLRATLRSDLNAALCANDAECRSV